MQNELGSSDYIQMKGGVGMPPDGTALLDWVKGEMPIEIRSEIEELTIKLALAVQTLVRSGLVKAQSSFNS